jgi:transposase
LTSSFLLSVDRNGRRDGVLGKKVWARLLGVERGALVEGVDIDEDGACIVASVRPRARERGRCGSCGRRCPGYDPGEGRRRWRTLDVGTIRAYLEADAPRVRCPLHGVVVARVPWACHDARHTRGFDDQAAPLAVHTSKTAVVELLRVAWRTVGAIVARVVAEGRAAHDPFEGLRRIGIDEISFKRGHRYLMVVVDHDTGRPVWAAPGHDAATLAAFFDLLGEERCARVALVSADAAEWIGALVAVGCPAATLCLDAFHVVAWAGDALDEVRREVWDADRRAGATALARGLKGARFALWERPERLTGRQRAKLAWISRVNAVLYRAHLLKEQLRAVFGLKGEAGIALLERWLAWACRSRTPPSST